MKKEKDIVIKIADAIESDKFNWKRYTGRKSYYGYEIITEPLHASYGQIGFSVSIYKDGQHIHTLSYDWELERFSVDDETINDYKRHLTEIAFAEEMAELLKKYNAEMTVVETKIAGKRVTELSILEPERISDDDVIVFDKEVNTYI